jgi:hypothetical protein
MLAGSQFKINSWYSISLMGKLGKPQIVAKNSPGRYPGLKSTF